MNTNRHKRITGKTPTQSLKEQPNSYEKRLREVEEMELIIRRDEAQQRLFFTKMDEKINAFIDIELKVQNTGGIPPMVSAVIIATRNEYLQQIGMPEEDYLQRKAKDNLAMQQYQTPKETLNAIHEATKTDDLQPEPVTDTHNPKQPEPGSGE